MNKEVRKLVTALEKIDGVEVVQGTKHLKVLKGGAPVSQLPVSPSDYRWHANALAELRRAGITPATTQRKRKKRRTNAAPIARLRAQVSEIVNRGELPKFVRFMLQMAEMNGWTTYSSVSSAENSLRVFVKGTTAAPKFELQQALAWAAEAWAKQNETEEIDPVRVRHLAGDPTPLTHPAVDSNLVVRVDLDRLNEALGQLGVSVELVST